MTTNYAKVLQVFSGGGVEFVLIGGAAGRPRDLESVAELQAPLEERRQRDPQSCEGNPCRARNPFNP